MPHVSPEPIASRTGSQGAILTGPNVPDAQALVHSARDVLTTLEPWYQANKSSTNPHVVNLAKKIVRQTDSYRSAISTSIETAADGQAFARDATVLCAKLAEGTEPIQNLLSFVDSMQKIAEKSYCAAEQTNKKFRAIRVEIGKISSEIPTVTAAVKDANAKTLSVPARLSSINWLLGSNLRMKQKSIAEIVSELERVQNLLCQTMNHVSCFVNWWGSMSHDLKALRDAIPTIAADGSNPIRMAITKERWEDVQLQYTTYIEEMPRIEDLFHHDRSFWSKLVGGGHRNSTLKLIKN